MLDWLSEPYVMATAVVGVATAAFLALLVGIVVQMRKR